MTLRTRAGTISHVLRIVALLLIAASPSWAYARDGESTVVPNFHVTFAGKVLGQTGRPGMMAVAVDTVKNVAAADLGAPALYHNQWYLAFGDTTYSLPIEPDGQNFLVGTATFSPGSAMTLNGFVAMHRFGSGISAPVRAITPDPGYALPSQLFTVHWHGSTALFGQFVEGGDVGGFGHWSHDTRIVRFDDARHVFRPYKPTVYVWRRSDDQPLQYSFGQSSFWQDDTYLYMVGTTTNRFGGIKLGRIALSAFMNEGDATGWQYFLSQDRWSPAVSDETAIDGQVPWLIPPADPAFSFDTNALPSACSGLGIGEFSLVWDAYAARFLLLTGTDGCTQTGTLRVFTAAALSGPWTPEARQVAMPHADWDYYAPYTSADLVVNGGRSVYFVASTYSHYGVYLYRLDL